MRKLTPSALSAIRVLTTAIIKGGEYKGEGLTPDAENLFQALRDEKIDEWIVQNPKFVTAM